MSRKIIAIEFVSLDGVMQAPGGPEEDADGGFKYGGWTVPYFDDTLGAVMGEQMQQPFALLLGKKTYEIFASYWPQREGQWPGVNGATKYVVTDSNTAYEWDNAVYIKSNVVDELKKVKAQDGPHLHVFGSSALLQTLLKEDLVDEFWLKIFPVTLGKGKRLFGEGTIPAAFKLTKSKISPSGVIIASYERAGSVKTGQLGT